MNDNRVIGKNTVNIHAGQKVTGQAVFASDFKLHNMLYGKVLRSPLPHARILNIDTSGAEKIKGVRVIVTGKDIPKVKFGPNIQDEYALAVDKVRYIGDEVAIVAAEDEDTASAALELIKVDYEPLPAVFEPEAAMQEGAPLVHHQERNIAMQALIQRGDLEKGFAQSDYILAESYSTPLVHQCYLEPITCVAEWHSTGKLTVWAPTQEPFIQRHEIATALQIPESNVRIIQPFAGGGFGGKCDQKLLVVAAVLARNSGRPVRLANTRKEEFFATRPRAPMTIDLKMGVRKDGKIMAKQTKIVIDNGAYTSQGIGIWGVATIRSDSLYHTENITTESFLVYSNKVPTGAFRGFGNPQMHFALETHLDALAKGIHMDPLELRLKNIVRKGDTTVHGWKLDSCGLEECLVKAADAASWKEKREKKTTASDKVRGIGLACLVHVSGNRAVCPDYDGSSALVEIHRDGKVKIFCGEPDVGQGSATLFAQIAAEELSLKVEEIEVENSDTDRTPYCLGAFASRVTALGGNAVKLAVQNARQELLDAVAKSLRVSREEVTFQNGKIKAGKQTLSFKEAAWVAHGVRAGAPVLGVGMYDVGFPLQDVRTMYGNASIGYPFGVQVAEVEVDTKTGEVEILNYVAAQDVGKAINPIAVEGQIEGGIVQGIGYALMEEQQWENGKILNPSFCDYKIPTMEDVSSIEVILVETNEPKGPYGAKGAGEPPIVPTAPAIANAIYDAVGIRIKELPMNPEKILREIKKDYQLKSKNF